MEKYQLTIYPNIILTQKSKFVENITKKETRLIDNMLTIMLDQQGIGLAAPQVGASVRIITYLKSLQDLEYDEEQDNFCFANQNDNNVVESLNNSNSMQKFELPEANKQDVNVLINPKIVSKSSENISYEEGCLSLPGVRALVTRPRYIKISYLNRDGSERQKDAKDLEAICIQHEIDHLDGILFIDHLSRLKKKSVVKKYLKQFTKEK